MQELLVKEAILTIPYGEKRYKFLIKQATLEQILEFDYYLQQPNEQIVLHVFNLLKQINPDLTTEIFAAIEPKEYRKIHEFILKNYCTGFYTKKEENNEERSKKQEEIASMPFSAVIAGIVTNSNETIESLLKLTWEQIEYLAEGVHYNINEQTEDGKAENARNQAKKDIKEGKYDDTLAKLRANREKLNAKFINNNK